MQNEPLEMAAQTVILERDNREEIATLAYAIWIQRGSPVGSPEEDWFRAEKEVKKRKVLPNALRELIDAPPPKPELRD